MRALLLSLALLASSAHAQISLAPALLAQRGTTLPANCQVGQLFFKTDATAGQNVYGCTATNTWTAQGGASGMTITGTPQAGQMLTVTDATHLALTTAGAVGPLWLNGAAAPAAQTVIGSTLVSMYSVNTTSTASTQTAKQTLLSSNLNAGALAVAGQCVEVHGWGTAKATANAKTQTIDFGATTVSSTGAIANNGGNWEVRAKVYRVGAVTQTAFGSAMSATTPALVFSTPGETLSGAITIALTSLNVTDVDGTVAKGLEVRACN